MLPLASTESTYPVRIAFVGMSDHSASLWANVMPPAALIAHIAALPSFASPERMTATERTPASIASDLKNRVIVVIRSATFN